jgi:hypothetical protein
MRGARDGATLNDPRLVWHPPPRADRGADAGTHAKRHGALSTEEDDENKNSISSSADGDDASVGALDALDDLDLDAVTSSVRDDLDELRTGETRTVDRSTAATSGVLLSCERCSHHGVCALGGECQCAAMFEGKACRITRALAPTSETSDLSDLAGSGSQPDPVLAGFARGFGGSMTLTRENAPAKLEARPIESDAAAHNAGVAAEEHLEVEDDWTRRDETSETSETSGAATLSLSRVDDGHPDFHSGSRSDSSAISSRTRRTVASESSAKRRVDPPLHRFRLRLRVKAKTPSLSPTIFSIRLPRRRRSSARSRRARASAFPSAVRSTRRCFTGARWSVGGASTRPRNTRYRSGSKWTRTTSCSASATIRS